MCEDTPRLKQSTSKNSELIPEKTLFKEKPVCTFVRFSFFLLLQFEKNCFDKRLFLSSKKNTQSYFYGKNISEKIALQDTSDL